MCNLACAFIFIGILSRSKIAGSEDMLNTSKFFPLQLLHCYFPPTFLLAMDIINIFPFLPALWLKIASHYFSLHVPDKLLH